MATLQLAKSAGRKIETGDKILCGVDVVDTTPIANRVSAFQKVHLQYTLAESAVRTANRAIDEQRERMSEVRQRLNRGIEMLAVQLPTEGFDRKQPFRALGGSSPSMLQKMPVVKAAESVIALEKAVSEHAGISAKTKQAAAVAGQAARSLLDLVEPLAELEQTRRKARAKRDAFAAAWDKAFSSLKLGARAAEDIGHAGLFAALFERPAAAKKKTSSAARDSEDKP
jgi:hypothetical protein